MKSGPISVTWLTLRGGRENYRSRTTAQGSYKSLQTKKCTHNSYNSNLLRKEEVFLECRQWRLSARMSI